MTNDEPVPELYNAYTSVFRDAKQSPPVVSLAAQRYEPYTKAVAEVFASERARVDLDHCVLRLRHRCAVGMSDDRPRADLASVGKPRSRETGPSRPSVAIDELVS